MRKTCWAALALLFAVEGRAEPCCRPAALAAADLDGDGIVDAVHSSSDRGSGMSSTEAEVVLSRTGRKIEVFVEFSFTPMVSATAVPAELLAPGSNSSP